MSQGRQVACVLCQRAQESEVTGPLSTKAQVTAHQNCLLFSSGIFCRHSPQFDDLFGFAIKDVMNEVKRGSKLSCKRCGKKGATAGCEVRRCKRSYHYPCAIKENAKTIEDPELGNYGLYCFQHYQKLEGILLTEGNILEVCLIALLCCVVINVSSSHKRKANDDSTAAGPSLSGSDSNSASSVTRLPYKRRLSLSDKQENPSKLKSGGCTRRVLDEASDSEENVPNTEMEIFAPLESDLEESANSVLGYQFISKDIKSPKASTSGNHVEDEHSSRNKEDETIIDSDAESESLLPPVEIRTECAPSVTTTSSALSPQTVSSAYPKVIVVDAMEVGKGDDEGSNPEQNPIQCPGRHSAGPSVPRQSSPRPPPSPARSKPHSVAVSPPCTGLAISPTPPDTICVSLTSSSPSPIAATFDPEPSINSRSFWRSCNAAGCTQAIFTDFISEMNNISSRIQSDQASQEDYDLALTAMVASGKLAELVAKQQIELQQKQVELKKAAAAMREVVSALKR